MHFVHDLAESLTPGSAVINIGDKGYEESIKRWAVTAEKRAGLVVFPSTPPDVSKTILCATRLGVELAITGGSHSTSGSSSTDGGISMNLSRMRGVTVDPEAMTVTVQGGALWEDVDKAAAEHRLATVGGTVNLTGVGGLTLGGGYGYLSGAYGTVVDNLLSVQMVLASGEIISVSERQNPELFWAIRGAGAAFGVVTEFVFRAYKQENLVWAGMLAFPPDKLSSILECANHVIEVSKGEATIMVGFTTPQPDLPPCILTVVFYNGPEQSAKALFEPILKLDPLLNTTAMIPYPEVNAFHNANVPDGARRTMKGSTFTAPVDIPFVESMFNDYVSFIQSTPDARKTLILWEFISPHKIMSVPHNATSFANRGPYGNVVFVTEWTNQELDTVCREWTRNMARKARNQLLKTRGGGQGVGVYTNYEGMNETPAKMLFGDNYERLVELKRRYDPTNVFGRCFNLMPGHGGDVPRN
ncbi:4cea01ae-853c-4aa6-89f7-956b08009338 [Sclerotinia trifoliorum]|uniref:4cea01ae-853c-4aa6-89f7-956b08009338 n=1 Tax=Sclerotinia trifoliorum TaxID=28548 RepID=A0A8H2ZKT0_9HELO|nr:4cea01ae-853c-4aa6-89f7-956b08009338 [Sclerotinia trifoliorum]